MKKVKKWSKKRKALIWLSSAGLVSGGVIATTASLLPTDNARWNQQEVDLLAERGRVALYNVLQNPNGWEDGSLEGIFLTKMVDDLNALVENMKIQPFLDDEGNSYGFTTPYSSITKITRIEIPDFENDKLYEYNYGAQEKTGSYYATSTIYFKLNKILIYTETNLGTEEVFSDFNRFTSSGYIPKNDPHPNHRGVQLTLSFAGIYSPGNKTYSIRSNFFETYSWGYFKSEYLGKAGTQFRDYFGSEFDKYLY